MAAKSRMEKYMVQILDLISRGASVRSTWKIINSNLPEEAKISYNAFLHFVNKNVKPKVL
ncbi:MAG: hypothetical protein QM497_04390 [Sulfurimonas sp.]